LTAARLYDLEGLPTIAPDEPIDLTFPGNTRERPTGIQLHYSRQIDRADRALREGLPVTSLTRTIVDLSAVLDEKDLVLAFESGLARYRSVDLGVFRSTLRRLETQGRTGMVRLRRLVGERAPNAPHLDSPLERQLLSALKHAGLPTPRAHYDVVEGGRHIAEIDFAYPRKRLAIQAKGKGVHLRPSVWEKDARQESELVAAGWSVIPVTSSQVRRDIAGVVDLVARALGCR
jgi:hypothetical protein